MYTDLRNVCISIRYVGYLRMFSTYSNILRVLGEKAEEDCTDSWRSSRKERKAKVREFMPLVLRVSRAQRDSR